MELDGPVDSVELDQPEKRRIIYIAPKTARTSNTRSSLEPVQTIDIITKDRDWKRDIFHSSTDSKDDEIIRALSDVT